MSDQTQQLASPFPTPKPQVEAWSKPAQPIVERQERMVSVPETVILAAQALVGLPATGKWDEQTMEALREYVAQNVLLTDAWPDAWQEAFTRIHAALQQLPVTPDERVAWLSDLHKSIKESL